MKVEYEFDKKQIEELGYTEGRVKTTVMRIHKEKGLPCVSSGSVLAFADNGRREDYSNLWINISRLINSKWFLECATALRWFDNNDDDIYEDILAQADLLIRKRA